MVMKAYGDGIQYGIVLFGPLVIGIDSGFVSFDPNANPLKNVIKTFLFIACLEQR